MQWVRIETVQGRVVAQRVGLAASFLQRFRGLLGRRELAFDHGLLLRPGGSIHTLWMRFPIDALFLDRQLRVLAIVHELAPNRFALAPIATRAVLELAAGRAAACGLAPGVALRLRMQADENDR